ncbi:MAG: hypothetical protein PVG71_06130 [Anaerolineae bacterium]|jgi:hypothetical protein
MPLLPRSRAHGWCTYDLLQIGIYPFNTRQSAHAFLLALRAKGYHLRVVVTDMRTDYWDVVA